MNAVVVREYDQWPLTAELDQTAVPNRHVRRTQTQSLLDGAVEAWALDSLGAGLAAASVEAPPSVHEDSELPAFAALAPPASKLPRGPYSVL